MTTRAELEAEWLEYQLWIRNQSLRFEDYLEHRDLTVAQSNLSVLKELIEGMDDSETITVAELKEILRYA